MGAFDGIPVGPFDGAALGLIVVTIVGDPEGIAVGPVDGHILG